MGGFHFWLLPRSQTSTAMSTPAVEKGSSPRQQAELLRAEVRARSTRQVVQRASGLEGNK